ncbi:FecCD family ABC transporter permease [Mobilicoccus caccae]|uniref:ABC transporter permease n=1 Tax=Mobilicoccus caccae TaxID=1859295 RepID=A0ABQ6IUD2_9MICO|nr:iron ABC transporter permease [Mobilicoccus caccae]GMA41472.1 ABC transporter permease [Mobilicoccus caccae]
MIVRSPGARRHLHPGVVAPVALALLVAGLVVSGMIGPSPTAAGDVLDIAYRRAHGVEYVSPGDRLVSEIRLPRGVLAAVVGVALGVVGCVLQAVVRNPLADPGILGGTSGASLGAVLAIVLGAVGPVAGLGVPAGAFIGAAGGFGLSMMLAARPTGLSPLRLVLAGMAVSFLLSALANVVVMRAGDDRKMRSAVFWQMGSVADATWHTLLLPLVLLVPGTVWLMVRARRLDALAFGDDTAMALGMSPSQLRLELLVIAALLTGVCVAVAGGVGFVALVVPHAVRIVVGPIHRRLLPCVAVAGAAFLTWADVAARVVAPPADVPLGVVTALVGAPVFAALLRTGMNGGE